MTMSVDILLFFLIFFLIGFTTTAMVSQIKINVSPNLDNLDRVYIDENDVCYVYKMRDVPS